MESGGLVEVLGNPRDFFDALLLRRITNEEIRAHVTDFTVKFMYQRELPKLIGWNVENLRLDNLRGNNGWHVYEQSKTLADFRLWMYGIFLDYMIKEYTESSLRRYIDKGKRLYEYAFELGSLVDREQKRVRTLLEVGDNFSYVGEALFDLKNHFMTSFFEGLSRESVGALTASLGEGSQIIGYDKKHGWLFTNSTLH